MPAPAAAAAAPATTPPTVRPPPSRPVRSTPIPTPTPAQRPIRYHSHISPLSVSGATWCPGSSPDIVWTHHLPGKPYATGASPPLCPFSVGGTVARLTPVARLLLVGALRAGPADGQPARPPRPQGAGAAPRDPRRRGEPPRGRCPLPRRERAHTRARQGQARRRPA